MKLNLISVGLLVIGCTNASNKLAVSACVPRVFISDNMVVVGLLVIGCTKASNESALSLPMCPLCLLEIIWYFSVLLIICDLV